LNTHETVSLLSNQFKAKSIVLIRKHPKRSTFYYSFVWHYVSISSIEKIYEVIVINDQVKSYLEKFPYKTTALFNDIRRIVFDSVSSEPTEVMWANLPSYYIGKSFVRLIAFKDHINIEARAITEHKIELAGYKITPKGMLQIFLGQKIPVDILTQIFADTLN